MNSSKKSYLLLVTILIVLLFAYRSYLKRNPVEKAVDQKEELIDHVEQFIAEKPTSKYLGNQLTNGSSPYDKLYGRGIYSNTNNSLKVINRSSSDVVILLIQNYTGQVIRNEYIQGNSSYHLTEIPNTTCYTKYYYGKNWNPTRLVKDHELGGFDDNELFVISNKPNDIIEFREYESDGYIYYSEFEITLETIEIEGTKMSERNISSSEFFGE